MGESVQNEVALELPLDAARTPTRSPRLECSVLATSTGATAEQLAATFAIALARYNGQAAIPLSAARLRRDGTVGWSGTVCLDCHEGVSGQELLAQLGAELARPPRPLASVTGNHAAVSWLENGDGDADVLGVLSRASLASAQADLHLVVDAGGARAWLVHDAALFARTTIERLARHLDVLLAALAACPATPISRLPLLTASEQGWLDEVACGAQRSLPTELVYQSFERHAAATPEAIAVKYRDQELSYGALDRRANQLARHLAAQGIGRGARIVVCVEPAFDIVVALLGIFKAGATYVPIDPGYPPARVRVILDDTRPQLVLTQAHLVDRLAEHGYPVLALDRPGSALDALDDTRLDLPADPEAPASVYYTSGTTGLPKGVLASQANVRAYIQLAQERYEFSRREIMPAIARFSFSISMFELMSPLVAGGTLVVLDRDHVLDPERLARTLTGVTFFHAGPSLLRGLLPFIAKNYADTSVFAGVRHASSGGDLIAPELLEALKTIFARAEVFVIYGCSEISCMGCTYPVPRDREVTRTYVGRPFDNVTVRVLDRHFAPVPAGVVGEICFAGPGVVGGYLHRDELTAEKFLTPASLDGQRYYRTGDLGRLSADGWVEILGRNDFQVKVRGMRIELGEIEHTLRRAPGVRDAVVAARDNARGEKALVAYVVLDRRGADTPPSDQARRTALAEIRRHMTEQLPDYMVPAVYVELAAMPLNHNLKLDRAALPAPEDLALRGDEDGRVVRAPVTPTERRLAAHWQRLLGVTQIGRDDNFFELGGDSLLTLELQVALEAELGIAVDGMDILRETLQVLAVICDRRLGIAAPAPVPGPEPIAAPDPVTTFHFSQEQSLHGVLRGPASAAAREAVLVCPPLGQERVRVAFVLERLARELSARGIPSLRFDYYGTGDSLGDSTEATCTRWLHDVADAHRELQRRTGATRVVGIGVRLGATLLCAARTRFGLELDRLVLWDPVDDGAAFRAELERMHRTYLREMQDLRLGLPPRRRRGEQELMGTTYAEVALGELARLSISPLPAGLALPVRWLATTPADRQQRAFRTITHAVSDARLNPLEFDCAWLQTAQLEEIIPDHGFARTLAEMVRA